MIVATMIVASVSVLLTMTAAVVVAFVIRRPRASEEKRECSEQQQATHHRHVLRQRKMRRGRRPSMHQQRIARLAIDHSVRAERVRIEYPTVEATSPNRIRP